MRRPDLPRCCPKAAGTVAELKRLRDLRVAYLLGQLRYDPAEVAEAVMTGYCCPTSWPVLVSASMNGATPGAGMVH
jgi:hypothetical protein